jgi:hypothetical protein
LGGVPVRNVALPVAGRVHLEVLELELDRERELAMRMRGHPQASDPGPVARWP